jgi:hypothetical protein
MTERPRNIANDIVDVVETMTAKWTKQKKSEEKHPSAIRYRESRMTKEPRMTQKDAAWKVMEDSTLRRAAGAPCRPRRARSTTRRAPGSWR